MILRVKQVEIIHGYPGDPLKHVLLLEETMEKYGFIGYEGEWWHYTDEDSYDYVEFKPNERHS